jgi:hypothetical protein
MSAKSRRKRIRRRRKSRPQIAAIFVNFVEFFHALQHGAGGQEIFLCRQSIAGNPPICADDHISHRKRYV